MTSANGPIILTVVAWLTTVAVPQAPADFSGRWRVEPTPAASATPGSGGAPARGDMGSGWGPTIAITQDANQLAVESIIYSNYDLQQQPRYVYALDGSETRNTVIMGRGQQVQSSRTAWEGTTLRITTVHTLGDPVSGKPLTMDVTQKLSLAPPTSLVVEVTRSGVLGGKPSTTKTTYTKN